MSTNFTPPPPSSWQGPADKTFRPPPPSSWQGPADQGVPDAGAQMRNRALQGVGASMDQSQKPFLNMPSSPGFGVDMQLPTSKGGKLVAAPPAYHEASGPLENGIQDVSVGGSRIATPGHRRSGVHNIVKGATELGSVALPAAAVAAPIATAGALAGSTLGGIAGQLGANVMGASPDNQDLAGDAGALLGGGLGAKVGGSVNPATVAAMKEGAKAVAPELIKSIPVVGKTVMNVGSRMKAAYDANNLPAPADLNKLYWLNPNTDFTPPPPPPPPPPTDLNKLYWLNPNNKFGKPTVPPPPSTSASAPAPAPSVDSIVADIQKQTGQQKPLAKTAAPQASSAPAPAPFIQPPPGQPPAPAPLIQPPPEAASPKYDFKHDVLPSDLGDMHFVRAFDANNGTQVGNANFTTTRSGALKPYDVYVNEANRRQGVASGMYDFVKQKSGIDKIIAGDQQPDGKAFRQAYDSKASAQATAPATPAPTPARMIQPPPAETSSGTAPAASAPATPATPATSTTTAPAQSGSNSIPPPPGMKDNVSWHDGSVERKVPVVESYLLQRDGKLPTAEEIRAMTPEQLKEIDREAYAYGKATGVEGMPKTKYKGLHERDAPPPKGSDAYKLLIKRAEERAIQSRQAGQRGSLTIEPSPEPNSESPDIPPPPGMQPSNVIPFRPAQKPQAQPAQTQTQTAGASSGDNIIPPPPALKDYSSKKGQEPQQAIDSATNTSSQAMSRFTRTPIQITNIKGLADDLSKSLGVKVIVEGEDKQPESATGEYDPDTKNISVDLRGKPKFKDLMRTIEHEDVHALLAKEEGNRRYKLADPSGTLKHLISLFLPDNTDYDARTAFFRSNRSGDVNRELPAYMVAYEPGQLQGLTREQRDKWLQRYLPTLKDSTRKTLLKIIAAHDASDSMFDANNNVNSIPPPPNPGRLPQ